MEFSLTITSIIETDDPGVDRRSNATAVKAESNLESYEESDVPFVFFGKLTDASEEQILNFQFGPGVEVVFRGATYKFEELAKSGLFKLVRCPK